MQLWLIIIRLALCLAVFHTSFSCLQPYQLDKDFAISPKKRSGWQTEGRTGGNVVLSRTPSEIPRNLQKEMWERYFLTFSKRCLCWKKNKMFFTLCLAIQFALSSFLLGAEVSGSHKPTGKLDLFQCRPSPMVHLSACWQQAYSEGHFQPL